MYLTLIENEALQNKYTTWYLSICTKASQRAATRKEAKEKCGYVEGHHIFPRCLGTEEQNKDAKNLVYLTFREHVICHLLLTKMFSDSRKYKLQHACNSFNKTNDTQKVELQKLSSRLLELLRKQFVEKQSVLQSGCGNINYGGRYTSDPVIREKMRKPKSVTVNMGKYTRTDRILMLQSENRKGKGTGVSNAMASVENRAKVSASKVGKKRFYHKETGIAKMMFPEEVDKNLWLTTNEHNILKTTGSIDSKCSK